MSEHYDTFSSIEQGLLGFDNWFSVNKNGGLTAHGIQVQQAAFLQWQNCKRADISLDQRQRVAALAARMHQLYRSLKEEEADPTAESTISSNNGSSGV